MNSLDNFRLQRELKEHHLDFVCSIYGPQYPDNYGFDITMYRHTPANTNQEIIIVRAIVYLRPYHGKWKLLKQSSTSSYRHVPALQQFSRQLEREMDLVCGDIQEGDVYGSDSSEES